MTTKKYLVVLIMLVSLVGVSVAGILDPEETHHQSSHKMPWWQIVLIAVGACVLVGLLVLCFYCFGCFAGWYLRRGIGPANPPPV